MPKRMAKFERTARRKAACWELSCGCWRCHLPPSHPWYLKEGDWT